MGHAILPVVDLGVEINQPQILKFGVDSRDEKTSP